MIQNFEQMLQKYADVTVRIGLNIRKGQRLVIGGPLTRGVDIELAPLVRLIAASAYKAGARYVDVIWGDPLLRLQRYQMAPRDSFDEFSTWVVDARVNYLKNADAILTISADDPALLKGQDPALVGQEMHAVARIQQTDTRVHLPQCRQLVRGRRRSARLGSRVFPDGSPEEQVDSLWKAIFSMCRIDQPDPVAAWDAHVQGSRHALGLPESQGL